MLQNKSIKFALIISIPMLLILILGLNFIETEKNIYLFAFLFSLIIFVLSYFTIKLYLRKKFDKLYRTINKTRMKPIDFNFTKAEDEIEQWVKDKLLEIQNLKANEEFRKEFIGNLAHELKTPVFSSQGYILTLLEGGLEDETINLKFLKKASKNIDRISDIIKDMDTISQIESNNLKLDLTAVDLVDLVQSIFEEFEDKALKKGIKLELIKQDVNQIFVLVDKRKMKQVFTNLILNSIFYGKEKGKTEVILTDNKGKIGIEIKDNGIGIEEKHIPRLFERFYRVEKSRDRNKGGSGIGLAIVKHVIEAHKESVEVKSKKGEGTSFYFSLEKSK